jgi:hypothetical protein
MKQRSPFKIKTEISYFYLCITVRMFLYGKGQKVEETDFHSIKLAESLITIFISERI